MPGALVLGGGGTAIDLQLGCVGLGQLAPRPGSELSRPAPEAREWPGLHSHPAPHGPVAGERLEVVQKEVAEMLRGRILVGHALHNDLKVRSPSPPACASWGGY